MDQQLNQRLNNTTDERRKEILRRLQQRRDDEAKNVGPLDTSANCDHCNRPCSSTSECMCGHRYCSRECADELHKNLGISSLMETNKLQSNANEECKIQ